MKEQKPRERSKKRIDVERAAGVTSWGLSQMVAQLVGLPRAKKAVLRVLADHYPNIWPKIETIADQAGYSPSRTRAVMRELETEGYIRCLTDTHGGVARTAQYAINVAKIKALLEEQTQQPVLPLSSETQQPVLPLDNAETNPTLVGANPTLLEHEPTNGRRVNPPMVGANPPMVGAEHTKNREFQHTSEQRRQQRSAHALDSTFEEPMAVSQENSFTARKNTENPDAAMRHGYECFAESPKARIKFSFAEASLLAEDGFVNPPDHTGKCEIAGSLNLDGITDQASWAAESDWQNERFEDLANWFAELDTDDVPGEERSPVCLPHRDRIEFNPGMGLPDPPLVEEFA